MNRFEHIYLNVHNNNINEVMQCKKKQLSLCIQIKYIIINANILLDHIIY